MPIIHLYVSLYLADCHTCIIDVDVSWAEPQWNLGGISAVYYPQILVL